MSAGWRDRSTWLAAANTVTTGAGDRSAAEETVHQQVMPYVDNDIRIDWVGAMRSATASVTARYDAAIHALTSTPEVCFEVPGELGPSWQPAVDEPLRPTPSPTPTAPPVPTVPAAAPAPPPPITEAPQPLSTGATRRVVVVASRHGSAAAGCRRISTGAGNLGGAGGLAGSIGGVIGQIVDSIGGLLGSLAGGLGDAAGDPLADDPFDADDPPAEDADGPGDTDDAAEPAKVDEDDAADQPVEQATESPPPPADAVGEPAAQDGVPPVDPPPPAAPPPADQSPTAAGPQPDGPTPCEIAEDELPQAGQ